jgi:hypothetical protein
VQGWHGRIRWRRRPRAFASGRDQTRLECSLELHVFIGHPVNIARRCRCGCGGRRPNTGSRRGSAGRRCRSGLHADAGGGAGCCRRFRYRCRKRICLRTRQLQRAPLLRRTYSKHGVTLALRKRLCNICKCEQTFFLCLLDEHPQVGSGEPFGCGGHTVEIVPVSLRGRSKTAEGEPV